MVDGGPPTLLAAMPKTVQNQEIRDQLRQSCNTLAD